MTTIATMIALITLCVVAVVYQLDSILSFAFPVLWCDRRSFLLFAWLQSCGCHGKKEKVRGRKKLHNFCRHNALKFQLESIIFAKEKNFVGKGPFGVYGNRILPY